ncbi:kinase suppressor of Ras 1-like isoform X5 [Nerophis ophidion]|uniref:kinase suppressor of Ras 1-like isoform X5 n=2 Tax=Nerophis ophidion TaxID=159077 RepID=UPI002ADF15D2|nr:kinase suppressor of Ras 1-like isoform X5 [Nerophis ophidion]
MVSTGDTTSTMWTRQTTEHFSTLHQSILDVSRRGSAYSDSFSQNAKLTAPDKDVKATTGKFSVLQTSSSEVQDTMKRLGSSFEDGSHLPAALACLSSPTDKGGDVTPDSQEPAVNHGRLFSVSVLPCSDENLPHVPTEEMFDAFSLEPSKPPSAQASQTCPARTVHTPPSCKLLQPLSSPTLLKQSKSHESQLANRIEEPANPKRKKALAAIQLNGCGSSLEDSNSWSSRTPSGVPASAPYSRTTAPSQLDNLAVQRSSPHAGRRDIDLPAKHRFSTKSWLSQTCQVCGRNMMFGLKCKHCKFKCHNKCTKGAPSCRILFPTLPRAESVPSDINNGVDLAAKLPLQFATLPKAKGDSAVAPVQLDSSSNPSSTTSSTPSSPAPSQQSNPASVSATPSLNTPPGGSRHGSFHFPEFLTAYGEMVLRPRDMANDTTDSMSTGGQQSDSSNDSGDSQSAVTPIQVKGQEQGQKAGVEYPAGDDSFSVVDFDEDGLDDLPSSVHRRGTAGRWRRGINGKASQTSVYLQEWDIPYEELQLGELIGKGRWGKVYRGRWHGEVAIRLVEIDGNNQEHLKLFKEEVMNYRQTRHENVILFMGACMAPPHLAIVTSFCKGVTLYSLVRERGHLLDLNNTRQIAQEIVKGMGYLHAKGIIHKDLKSKNVFYDSNRVVLTDFGLIGMSGVVQERRTRVINVLRIPRGWIHYLSPEIVRKMSPEIDEDQLPFSKAADVYAFGTIWHELHFRTWPMISQPMEAKIWLVGSSEGIKKVLEDSTLGKEVTEILSACWSFAISHRPTFTQLTELLDKLPKLNRRLSHPGHF